MVNKLRRKVTIYNSDGTLSDQEDHNLIGKHLKIEGPFFTDDELEDSCSRYRDFMKDFKSHYIDDYDKIRKWSVSDKITKDDGNEL